MFSCSTPRVFNPYDKAWQKKPEFSNDKERQWEERPISRDFWWMSQNSIRSGMKDMHAALRAVSGRFELNKWQAEVIKAAWVQHKELISSSLKNQSEVVMPFLAERINLDRMKERSLEIQQAADRLDGRVTALKASESKKVLQTFQKAFEAYQAVILEYLGDQEEINLPLMRCYFTPAEARPVVQKLLSTMAPVEIGSLIFYAGDECWFEFMGEEGGISCLRWFCSLKSKRDDFEIHYVQPLAFVTRGVPLSSLADGCSFW